MHQLLQRYAQLHSYDVDQVQHHVAQVLCPHHLKINNASQLNTHLYYRASQRLGWGRLRYGATVHIQPQPLTDFYLLQIPIQGHEKIQLSHQSFYYSSQRASLLNPNQMFSMQHSQHTDKLFIRICKTSLEHFFQKHYQRPLQGELLFTPALALDQGAGASLWRLLQWQFQEASEGSWFEQAQTQRQLEDTFFACLLDVWEHNQLLPSIQTLTPHAIKQAKDYIHQHLTEPLSVTRIAQHVGISTRSLYAGFKDFVGISPMQYVKKQRLHDVHQRLLQADPQRHTVTELALLAGFSHLGQFAADYQRLYGVRPSVTLQQNA